jgi:beta-1,4-mannosyltransferase
LTLLNIQRAFSSGAWVFSIRELVKDQDNGLLFSSPSELANQLLDLFKGFPKACDLLATLRTGALASGSATRWDDEWREHVLPLLTKVP